MGDRQTAEVGDIRAAARASPGLARPPGAPGRRRTRADRVAFALTSLLFGADSSQVRVTQFQQYILFCLTLPGWVFLAKLYGLYDHDEERTDHTTLDDFVGVFHLVTSASGCCIVVSRITGLADPGLRRSIALLGDGDRARRRRARAPRARSAAAAARTSRTR